MASYNTDCKEVSGFSPHGSVRRCINGEGIATYYASGPFNREFADFFAHIEQTACNKWIPRGRDWVGIVVMTGECTLTPEAVNVFKRYLRKMRRCQVSPSAAGFVFKPGSPCALLGRTLYREIFHYANINYAAFTCFDDALMWAEQQKLATLY